MGVDVGVVVFVGVALGDEVAVGVSTISVASGVGTLATIGISIGLRGLIGLFGIRKTIE